MVYPFLFRNDARAKGSANHVGVSEVDADQLAVAVNTYEKKLRSARFIMIMKPAITARASAGRSNGHQSMFDSDDVAGRAASDMGRVTSPNAGWTWSGYMQNLLAQTDHGGGLSNYDGSAEIYGSDPDMYGIEILFLHAVSQPFSLARA